MNSSSAPDAPSAGTASIQEALRKYLQQAPLPFAITHGPDHTLSYCSAAFCAMTGISSPDSLGSPISGLFKGQVKAALESVLDTAFREGADQCHKVIGSSEASATGWQCSVWPTIGPNGRTESLGIEIRESVSPDPSADMQRQVAEQLLLAALREQGIAEQSDAAQRRAAFLAEASRLLCEAVDQSATLVALTKLSLPDMGAWCIVDILAEGGGIQRLGIFHPDPDKHAIARQLETSWAPEPDDPFGAPEMKREARPITITQDIESTLAATAHSPENLIILRQLGIGSLLTVPLVARGRLLGAVTWIGAERANAFGPSDVRLAEDLATRGAVALDNAQMYDLAHVLRRNAETANRAKSAFLGAMSHELRTPLNAIGGYIDLLDMGLRGPVTEAQRKDFARVRTNQQHLSILITEILNYVRVGAGGTKYAETDIIGHDALTRAMELIEPLIGQRGLIFDGISCEVNAVLRADPEKVTQILVNLLSNAIKFTPAGGHIRAECAVEENTVALSIVDTGIGIARSKRAAVFEPFVQVKETLADRESGIGLGLAISRDLARAMGGDLTLTSVEGKGSTFTLSLPKAAA